MLPVPALPVGVPPAILPPPIGVAVLAADVENSENYVKACEKMRVASGGAVSLLLSMQTPEHVTNKLLVLLVDHFVQSTSTSSAGAPGWFAPAIGAALVPVMTQLAVLSAQIFNTNATRGGDPLRPLPGPAGM